MKKPPQPRSKRNDGVAANEKGRSSVPDRRNGGVVNQEDISMRGFAIAGEHEPTDQFGIGFWCKQAANQGDGWLGIHIQGARHAGRLLNRIVASPVPTEHRRPTGEGSRSDQEYKPDKEETPKNDEMECHN